MFTQSKWLKPYFSTKKGKKASNRFEKDLFKLMNNTTYGEKMKKLEIE